MKTFLLHMKTQFACACTSITMCSLVGTYQTPSSIKCLKIVKSILLEFYALHTHTHNLLYLILLAHEFIMQTKQFCCCCYCVAFIHIKCKSAIKLCVRMWSFVRDTHEQKV